MATIAQPARIDRAPSLFPGWPARIAIGGPLLAILVIRLIGQLDDPPKPFNDPATRNLLTLLFGCTALLAAWIWGSFFSRFSRSAQRTILCAGLVPVLLFAPRIGVLRFVEFSGNMVPRFVPRWAAVPDRQLGTVSTAAATKPIDLATKTPQDFPQFLGPDRSGWVAGPVLARDWTAQPPRQLWKRPIGAGWSAFATANGYAVTLEQRGDEEWVACYEIATGNPAWGHPISARHENPLGGIGPRSTPTIHEGRVYAMGTTGVLRCLDGGTGKLLWQDDLLKRYDLTQAEDEAMIQWGRAGSPLIVDDLVVVPGGGRTGKAKNLIAFKAATGEVAWESQNVTADGAAEQISYASPSLITLDGKRQIVIVNEATASGHDPATGERLWSHPWPGQSNMQANASQAVPISGNWLLLTKGYSGGAELLALAGEKPAPTSVWKNPLLLQTKLTNVCVIDGHVYGLSEGILECVEAASGQRKWKAGRYRHGQILGVGDLILVLAEDGRLALVEANPEKHVELGSIQALEGKTWNNLCLYGRKVLVRNGEEAACYELN